jgi:putative membrane protein
MGVGPLRQRYGLADDVDPRKIATFTLGVLVIFVAVLSPIHVVAEKYLFSVHMTQHVLITLIAPPFLIIGTPDWLIRPLLRPNWAFKGLKILTNPVGAFLVFNLVFSIWHLPSLYHVSVTNHGVHFVEHLLMVGTGVLVWWPLTSTMPELPKMSPPVAMLYLFGLSLGQIILFGALVFATEPLYEFYVNAPRISVLTPLTDQQVGAVIMKIGGGVLFLGLLIVIFFRWFGEEERKRIADSEKRRRQYESYYQDKGPELEDIPT